MHLFQAFVATFKELGSINLPRLSSALSFQVFFALAPLLFILLAGVGLFIDVASVGQQIVDYIRLYTTPEITIFFERFIQGLSSREVTIPAMLIGIGAMLVGVMLVVRNIFGIFYDIWGKKPQLHGFRLLLKRFIVASISVLIMGALLVGSIILSTALEFVVLYISDLFPYVARLALYTDFLFVTGISFLVLLMVYKLGPPVQVAYRHIVWPSLLVALALYGLKVVLTIYLGISVVSSLFGAASSIVILLIWIQFISTVFIFGAKLCEVSHRIEKEGR